jgi:hypothetical protein
MNIFPNIRLLLILILVIFCSCKKEKNGKFFLKVVPPTDTTIIKLKINDVVGLVPIDNSFHLVETRLELTYDLKNVFIYNHFAGSVFNNVTVTRYFGEFEKSTEDKYYTLIIKYKHETYINYDTQGQDYVWLDISEISPPLKPDN